MGTWISVVVIWLRCPKLSPSPRISQINSTNVVGIYHAQLKQSLLISIGIE